MDDSMLYLAIIVSVCVLLIIIIGISCLLGLPGTESPEKRAGRIGERTARIIIGEILTEDDLLLTNIKLAADDKCTELDNLIINSRGLFIIEVKNYSGEMFGSEEDYEWVKIKTTAEGNIYQKTIKNPINQVKRQIYILSRLLKEHGLDGIWIEGYVFFVEMNSPVESPYVLRTQQDIDEVIHNGIDNGISSEVIEQLTGLLDEEL